MICEFTYKHYLETVEEHKKVGTKLIMRHDIDLSLEKAMKFALMERDNGIEAFYFILMHSPYYNVLNIKGITDLQIIKGCGHKLGLHVDINFVDYVDIDRKILKSIVGGDEFYYSTHKTFTKGKVDLTNEGMLDINERPYKYLSDSGQHWREGCFCEHVGKYNKLMVLTHPIWWHYAAKDRENCILVRKNMNMNALHKTYMDKFHRLKLYDKKIQEAKVSIIQS